jgi:TonB family protein
MLDRTAYADLLLEIARHPAPTMVTSAARSNISARIERIISNIPPASPPRRWVRGVAVVALLPLFVLAAAKAQIPPTPAGSHSILDSGDHSEANYPVEAKRNGIEGYAIVNATIDEQGRVTYVQIVELSPADASYGFGESAERVARTMRFKNDKGRPTQVKFKVAFQLKDKHGPGAPLDGGGNGG